MLKTVYELEIAILESTGRCAELKEAVAQARFDLREANAAQVEYGGIRALMDKVSGKYADKAEALSRNFRKAEGNLQALLRRQEAEKQKLSSLQEQREAFPSWEKLRREENEEVWAAYESRLCAESLLPLLTRVEESLAQYRAMLRGEYPILSIETQADIATAPIAAAKACRPLVERLSAVQELPETGFLRSPAAFLSAAAKHNQLERAAEAAAQTKKLMGMLKKITVLTE